MKKNTTLEQLMRLLTKEDLGRVGARAGVEAVWYSDQQHDSSVPSVGECTGVDSEW